MTDLRLCRSGWLNAVTSPILGRFGRRFRDCKRSILLLGPLPIEHIGKQVLNISLAFGRHKQATTQRALALHQSIEALVEARRTDRLIRMDSHRNVYRDRACLADPGGAGGSLILDSGVPPA